MPQSIMLVSYSTTLCKRIAIFPSKMIFLQLKCTIYGGGSELLDANEASAEAPIEMRACSGHQDARISIGASALSPISQTNFPHLDFSLHQSTTADLWIFAACNRKISRKFKCTNCHPENCSKAVLQHARQPPMLRSPWPVKTN